MVPVFQGTVVVERGKAGEVGADRSLPDPPVEEDDIGMIFLHQFRAARQPVVRPGGRNIGEIVSDGIAPGHQPVMGRAIERSVLRIVHIGRDGAAHAEEEIVFYAMRGHPEMQTCRPNRFCQFTGGVAMRSHFNCRPVAQTAVIHGKAIVMLCHGYHVFRARLLE